MASGKKGAKGNKTAHVLNLLTAPGDAPPPGEAAEDASTPESAQSADRRPLLPPILEVAQANDDNLAQQIQQALEDEFSLPAEEAAPAKEETSVVEDKPASKMSQDDIEAMLASMSAPAQPEPEPAPVQEPPAPQSPSGGKMSQDDIEAMLASMSAPAQPEPEPAPVQEPPVSQSPSGGKMSQDDIEAMLASMSAPAQPEPEPAPVQEPPAPQSPSGGKMSQDDIEAMLASMSAPAQPEPEPAPVQEPPAPQSPSGGKMSQDDIEAMLASMSAPAQPEPEPAPVQEPPAAQSPSGGKMSQDDIEAMLASMSAPAQPEPEPAPVQEPPAAQPKPPAPPVEDISYTNIMQTLVEEKAPRYIKMFGLCTCKHCEADVKALTLSNLVPKYVVLSKQDMIPMLTVYEGRYNSTIIAQLTRSCKTVMDHPHHGR